jgi:hypothetical protein
MRFCNPATNRKPTTCTARFPRSSFVSPVKALEDVGQVCFRDTNPGINDGNPHGFLSLIEFD